MHIKRLIIAALLLPLLYLYITKLPPVYYAGLMVAAAVLALREFYSMYRVKAALKYTGMLLGALKRKYAGEEMALADGLKVRFADRTWLQQQ